LTITGAAMREFIHPSENRPLSLRECARLQTFPDDFVFTGATASCLQQIANAVPPLLAEVIAVHIATEYGFGAVYEPKRPHFQFSLTQSNGMSPALRKTESILRALIDDEEKQLTLFEETKKRVNESGKVTADGRQIDCLDVDAKIAYEFKLRVTIAASGQGRFAEELSFPVECRAAGLTPVLKSAPPEFIAAIASLRDDEVASKASEVITEK
jgi:hypothetical protein